MSKNERLQEYFQFTDEDLRENRRGELTGEQRSIIKGNIWKEVSYVLMIILGILFLVFVMSSASPTISMNDPNPAVLVILTLSAALFLVFRVLKKNDLTLYDAKGKVSFIRTRVIGGGIQARNTSELRVEGKVFKVRDDLMDILDQGDICQLFYTGGGDIVSVEFLEHMEKD